MADLTFVKLLLFLYPKHGQCGEAIHDCGVPLCCHGNVVVGCIYAVEEMLHTFVLYNVTSVLFYTVAFPRNQLNIIYNTRSLSDGLAKF